VIVVLSNSRALARSGGLPVHVVFVTHVNHRRFVAFDVGEPGENAACEWTSALPNAIRWHPHATDTSEMLKEGIGLRTWIRCGIEAARHSLKK